MVSRSWTDSRSLALEGMPVEKHMIAENNLVELL
jgi:hypothetical protein